jgi:hypothetical protein
MRTNEITGFLSQDITDDSGTEDREKAIKRILEISLTHEKMSPI